MTLMGWSSFAAVFIVILGCAKPLGIFMARVMEGERTFLSPVLGPVERLIYRLSGIDPAEEMTWRHYTAAVLMFSATGAVALYAHLRLQHKLPLNPAGMGPVDPGLAFNTAVSFLTNTNWQAYSGESTMSYLTQMAGLAYHNFVSAAAGIAVAVAVVRGFVRAESKTLGNFWADLVRSTLYILLPLSII